MNTRAFELGIRAAASSARTLVLLASTASGIGCSSSGRSSAVDLPSGWETATAVQSFSQAACSGDALDPSAPPESMDVTVGTRVVHVAFHHAHFRCSQTVEGFVRKSTERMDFLVQPRDMNPSTVVRCDCLYEITMSEDAEPGPETVSVYRRWDHYGGNPVDPALVGSASVTIP